MALPRTPPGADTHSLVLDRGGEIRHAGRARLGQRTKQLTGRLAAGDIAVIDHAELDRLSAQDLAGSGVGCVVNVAPSASGRYPNLGPSILVEAGVHLVDAPGAPLFASLSGGEEIEVEGGRIWRGRRLLAEGTVVGPAAAARALERGNAAIDAALEAFVANTTAHLLAERDLLAEPLELPALRAEFRDRPALVVVRGGDALADLRALRSFVRDRHPVLVAVDGGADVMAAAGLHAEVIVGDMDSVSDRALRVGAELVVHAYGDGRAPGAERLTALGLTHALVRAPGTSEDAALLLAAEKGARPVVSVGSGLGLVDFLDRGRSGMASTLLTRLRLGDVLVEARGLAMLLRS